MNKPTLYKTQTLGADLFVTINTEYIQSIHKLFFIYFFKLFYLF